MESKAIYIQLPDGEEKQAEFQRPQFFITRAQELIYEGKNVVVEKAVKVNDWYNEEYIDTWNQLAVTKGLWVKSADKLAPDDENYEIVIVRNY